MAGAMIRPKRRLDRLAPAVLALSLVAGVACDDDPAPAPNGAPRNQLTATSTTAAADSTIATPSSSTAPNRPVTTRPPATDRGSAVPCSKGPSPTRITEPGLWTASVDGRTRLLLDGDHPIYAWSPSGSQLAIAVARPDLRWSLAVVPGGGGPVVQPAPDYVVLEAQWTPDGQHLVFTSTGPGGTGDGLHVVAAGGGAVTTLWRKRGDQTFMNFAVDPQGGRVLFVYEDPNPALYGFPFGSLMSVNLDGSNLHKLADVQSPFRLSPDGRSVAVIANGSRAVIDLGTGRRVELAKARVHIEYFPGYDRAQTWSPDNRWVVFRFDIEDAGIYRPDGTAHWTVASDPVFSPDAHRVVWLGGTGADDFLVFADADGSNRTETDNLGVLPIDWLSSESLAVVPTNEGGRTQTICRLSVTDRKATPIVRIDHPAPRSPLLSPDRRTYALAVSPS